MKSKKKLKIEIPLDLNIMKIGHIIIEVSKSKIQVNFESIRESKLFISDDSILSYDKYFS